MRPFQQPEDVNHRFRDGSQFEQLTRLYDFDRQLRLLTMDAIERVEIASRSAISNHMGPAHGSHWYINSQMFHQMFDHQRLLTTLSLKQSTAMRHFQRECESIDRLRADDMRKRLLKRQRAKESYARYYPATYVHPPLMPGWAMLEELTLGDLSHLYKGLAKDADKKAIAKRLGFAAPPHAVLAAHPDHHSKHVRPSFTTVEPRVRHSSRTAKESQLLMAGTALSARATHPHFCSTLHSESLDASGEPPQSLGSTPASPYLRISGS